MLHQGDACVQQAQAEVFAHEVGLFGRQQHGIAVVQLAHFHQIAQPVQGFVPCTLPPGGVRVFLRGGFGLSGLQGAFQHQRHAGNSCFQTVQTQCRAGDVQIRLVFQGCQIAADGLFDRQQVGLFEAAQTAFDIFEHGNGHRHVARQQELLGGHVQCGFGFVHQPVGAVAQQFLIGAVGCFDLFFIVSLSVGNLQQSGGKLALLAAVFFQDLGVFAFAYRGLVDFLVEGRFLAFQYVLPLDEQEAACAQGQQRQYQCADGQTFAAGFADDDRRGSLWGLGRFFRFCTRRGCFAAGWAFRRPVFLKAV